METRCLGRTDLAVSVLTFGGVMLAATTTEDGEAAVMAALDAGINLFDVSDDYGDAEQKLGRTAAEIKRRGGYIATKTTERTAEAAWATINRSLELLQVDKVELMQLHSISSWEELEQVSGADGAAAAVLRARDEGLADFIGVTGHGKDAPLIHAEALNRFDLDTVLTPWNRKLSLIPHFADGFAALVEQARASDVGIMTIKTAARRNWKADEPQTSPAWYQPLTEDRHLAAAYAFVLSHPYITSATTPGDAELLDAVLRAERARVNFDLAAIDEALAELEDYSSIFEYAAN